MKLSSTETDLIGKWKPVNGKVEGDATCERMEWLTTSYLEKIASTNWAILFSDPEDGRALPAFSSVVLDRFPKAFEW